jgi:hypothetical protein
MTLHCSSMYLGAAQDDALSCYDSSSPNGSMSNYSCWATATDDESTTRRWVPARERPGAAMSGRGGARWLGCAGAGLGGGRGSE